MARKTTTKSRDAGSKVAVTSRKKAVKPPSRQKSKPVLLSGGNPQIAKADGDAPVQAYIAAMPGWKRKVGRQLDGLIVSALPKVRKAVKWNSPFYGVEGRGWFMSFHVFTNYVKVAFFSGTSLRPLPSPPAVASWTTRRRRRRGPWLIPRATRSASLPGPTAPCVNRVEPKWTDT